MEVDCVEQYPWGPSCLTRIFHISFVSFLVSRGIGVMFSQADLVGWLKDIESRDGEKVNCTSCASFSIIKCITFIDGHTQH